MTFGYGFAESYPAIRLAVPGRAVVADVKIAIRKTRRLNPRKNAGNQAPTFRCLSAQGHGSAQESCLR
jgi:hypothetical protein